MLLLVVICQIDSVNGQRAAINLGSKLEPNGVSKDKPKHRQPSESKSFAGTSWLDRVPLSALWTAILVLIATTVYQLRQTIGESFRVDSIHAGV